jgi:hypothetical protein
VAARWIGVVPLRHSIVGWRVDRFAKIAGRGKNLIYIYFSNKEMLFAYQPTAIPKSPSCRMIPPLNLSIFALYWSQEPTGSTGPLCASTRPQMLRPARWNHMNEHLFW